jgi:putative hemolysin
MMMSWEEALAPVWAPEMHSLVTSIDWTHHLAPSKTVVETTYSCVNKEHCSRRVGGKTRG